MGRQVTNVPFEGAIVSSPHPGKALHLSSGERQAPNPMPHDFVIHSSSITAHAVDVAGTAGGVPSAYETGIFVLFGTTSSATLPFLI